MKTNPQEDGDQGITLIEAALYAAGRPLDVNKLGSILGTRSRGEVRKLAMMLMEKYSRRDGALELVELEGDRFVLQLRPQYVPRVRRLVMRPPLSEGPLKTLAYIAYHQPVVQSRVIEARGSHAYKHIGQLKDRGLISTEKLGRTKIIRTTEAFIDYLNLSRNPRLMRRQLRAILRADIGKEKPSRSQVGPSTSK